MQRRQFLALSGLGLAGMMLPNARLIAAEELLAPVDVARKKALADTVLALARRGGASYCDVRIGRYLNQAIITREDKVQNVTNSESAGVGIRVIVDGAWGFAASNQSSEQGVAAAVTQALAIARANARIQTRPVQLAPTPGWARCAGRRRSAATPWRCRSRTRWNCCWR
ncbi:peptidase/modulator of DNA gyrase [Stenotrophomonas acidaminiphila]|uniref:Peptidase/modulator of DNA gyrase n=1 Tax=Stenotrophomonas acidaminiphila TaxID=128780 RepID=A0A0S1AVJ3_9GAMM|nr:peptidase/modulator of DNA gyrase [Stenotrophomonas acidaminiphila]